MKTSAPAARSRRRPVPLTVSAAKMFLVALTFGATAYAANDNLRDALLLDVGGRVTVDTTAYTRETGEVGTGNTNNRTAWFVWTAPTSTPSKVRFSTYGSNHNTTLNLYRRDPANTELLVTSLVPVAGAPENPALVDDDPTINVNTGYVEWMPQAGTTYYISSGRNAAGGGNSTLEATFAAVVAADGTTQLIPNDAFASALQFTAAAPAAGQVPRGQLVAGTTIGANAELGEDAILNATDPEGGTVWYRYTTGPTAEVFSVEVNGIPRAAGGDTGVVGDAILQAFTYTGAPTIATLVFAEEDDTSSITGTPRLVINAAANTEYYFRVTSTDGDGFNFNIRLDFNPTVPANDTIAAAVDLGTGPLPIVRNQGDDIYSATSADTFAGATSGNNVWFRWKAPTSGLVRLRSIAPTATATTGNFHPDGSTFLYDAEVFYDTSEPTDTTLDPATVQNVAGFDEGDPQALTFYAHKDVVYFLEIGGDNDINDAGRGFYAFVLEDLHVSDIARTGVSYGPEGVLKTIQPPVVNLTGDVAFQASLELGGPVTASTDTGLFLNNGTNTVVSVVEGQQEYGTPLDIDGDGISDDKVTFGVFSNLFLADRNPAGNNQPDLGFNATLAGKSDDEPVTKNNNRGFFHDDPTSAGVTEVRTNDYLNTSFTWQDGAGFLGNFNTPVRETFDNTALFTGKMVGIPAIRDTGIFASTPNVVVQEEDPAPNTEDGVEFGDVTGTPTVNSSDAMAFRATLRGEGVNSKNDSALYTVVDYNAAPTALNYRLRLRKGDEIAGPGALPLLEGATISSINEPRINGRGKIAVLANLGIGSGTPAVSKANDTVILSDLVTSDFSFSIVAREGDIARDENGVEIPGVKFASFVSPVLVTNNAVVFTAKISGTGVNAKNSMGIWLWDGNSTYQVARTGAVAQGVIPSGPVFKTLGAPLANPSGRVAFTASISGSGVSASNDTGLWTVSEDGVIPVLRLREGDIYDFGVVELPIRRTVTSIAITSGSGGDDGFARGIDQNGAVAVTTNLNKGKTKAGQAVFKITP